MVNWLVWLSHTAAFKGAVSGLVSAAIVDLHAFATWKSAHDVVSYDWGTAGLRWTQGIVGGALTGLGYGTFIG